MTQSSDTRIKRLPLHKVDAHVHIMTSRRVRGGIKWVRRCSPDYENLDLGITTAGLLEHLREEGVEYFYNFFYPLHPGESREINEWHRYFADSCPQAIPFASIHAADENKGALISQALDHYHMAGIKFHPYIQGFSFMDNRLSLVMEEMQERQCPVIFHTGFSEFYRQPSLAGDTIDFLHRYPRMKAVVAHMLYLDLPISDWRPLLEEYPGLYLDITNTFPNFDVYPEHQEQLQELMLSYSQRMVFGSDFPMGTLYPTGKLHDLLGDICPTQEILDDLMWRTACKIIGKDLFEDINPSITSSAS